MALRAVSPETGDPTQSSTRAAVPHPLAIETAKGSHRRRPSEGMSPGPETDEGIGNRVAVSDPHGRSDEPHRSDQYWSALMTSPPARVESF